MDIDSVLTVTLHILKASGVNELQGHVEATGSDGTTLVHRKLLPGHM